MIVAELMTANTVTAEPNDTLESAHKKMEAGRFRQDLVVDQQKLVGILTDRDTREHIGQLAHTRVDAVMSVHPFSVQPSTPVEEAAHMLVTNKIGRSSRLICCGRWRLCWEGLPVPIREPAGRRCCKN